MRLHPKSFNGYNINDGANYASSFTDPYAHSLTQATANIVNRGNYYPAYSGSKTPQEKTISVNIAVLCNPNQIRNTLTKYLNTVDQSMYELVAYDYDSGQELYVNAVLTNLVCESNDGRKWTAVFIVPEPEWLTVKTFSASKNITASGQTITCTKPTFSGNLEAEPIILISPVTARTSGVKYRLFKTIKNRATNSLVVRPIDITDGGMNTSALYSAGKVRSDLNDLRVFNNGIEIYRWFSSTLISSSTKVWCNISCQKFSTMTLNANVGTGDTDVVAVKSYRKVGKKRVYVLDGLPTSGYLIIENEQLFYDGIDVKNGYFYTKRRGQRGTTTTSHTKGMSVEYLENDIQIVYGDSSATAPTINDDEKPNLDLTNSTNTSWVFNTFGDDQSLSSARFEYKLDGNFVGDQSRIFTSSNHAGTDRLVDESPYTAMGVSIQSYQKGVIWKSTTVKDGSWLLYDPCGITTVTSSGQLWRKYITGSGIAPATVGLYKSKDGNKFVKQFVLTAPASAETWTAWSKISEALGATYNYIKFYLNGSLGAKADNEYDYEVLEVTLTLDNTKTPLITSSAETISGDTYMYEMTITNTTTSESLYISVPMGKDDTVIIDTSDKRAYVYGSNRSVRSGISLSSNRFKWLRFASGVDNVLQITETGLTSINLTVQWKERYN